MAVAPAIYCFVSVRHKGVAVAGQLNGPCESSLTRPVTRYAFAVETFIVVVHALPVTSELPCPAQRLASLWLGHTVVRDESAFISAALGQIET